jgi:membrane protease YdiL (CAAX protease family)
MTEPQTSSFDPGFPDIAAPPATSADVVPSTPANMRPPPRPWGPWATIGWTLLCIVVMFIAQFTAFFIFAAFEITRNPSAKLDDLAKNGNLWALATFFSSSAAVGFIALLVLFRHYPIRDYLALYGPKPRSVAIAFAGLAGLLVATDLTSYLMGRPLVPEIMVDVYRTAWLPGLVLALIILAPIGEETVFRGFLYTGIAASRAGPIVAIVVSSIVFALLHVQYDLHGMIVIAATGLYLGVVRYRAKSLTLNMLLHAVANSVATLEVAVQEHWLK